MVTDKPPENLGSNRSINPSSAIRANQKSARISVRRMLVLERVARTLLGTILQFRVFNRLAVFINQNAHGLAHNFLLVSYFSRRKLSVSIANNRFCAISPRRSFNMNSIFFCLFERHTSINKLFPASFYSIPKDSYPFDTVRFLWLTVFAIKHILLLLLKNISDYERKPAFSRSSTV